MATATTRTVPRSLMSVRMIHEETGIPLATAKTWGQAIAREDGVVRLPGLPGRVFFRRVDVERRLREAGVTWA